MAANTRNVVTLSKLRLKLLSPPSRSYFNRSELIVKYNLRRRSNTVKNYKYITDSIVAANVAKKLDVQGKLVIEASPGPGLLTRELIKNGAKKVIGLEPEKKFLPCLIELQNEVGCNVFEARFADFAKIDPHLVPNGQSNKPRSCKEPAISSKDLFKGFEPINWQSDELPVKFVGIEGGKTTASTTKVLISYLARIPTQESIFEMGRCQLSFFYAHDRLERLLARPGSRYYNRLSIMTEIFCDVEIVHREPCSSFDPYFRKDSSKELSLVSITPKKSVDISVPDHCLSFIGYFIRLLMIKPKQTLVTALEGICPGTHDIVRYLGWPLDIRACDLSPHQFAMLISEFFQYGGHSQLDFFYSMSRAM